MNISDFITTTSMTSNYKPRVLLAMLGKPNGIMTDKELALTTGIEKSIINNMVGKVLVQNGCLSRASLDKSLGGGYVYTLNMVADKNARQACLDRLEAFNKARGIK